MRELADASRIERFMRELGRAAHAEGRVYLTGGATAVLNGWRATTVDVDIKLIPEGKLAFHHFDPIAQALSKAERGHDQDRQDVRDLIASRLVDPAEARAQFEAIEPELYRFPAIDPATFRRAVEELFPI
jgi:hypothetical protein